MDIDIKQIKDLMRAIRQQDISELEISKNGESIRLKREASVSASATAPSMPSFAPSVAPAAQPTSAEPATSRDQSGDFIVSPFVGTFYRAPAPDAPVFIEEGQEFKSGQVICIVEAMKLMNEIEAETDGILLEALVENGKPVEFGDKLFRIKKH